MKKIFGLVLVLVLLFSFASCSDSGNGNKSEFDELLSEAFQDIKTTEVVTEELTEPSTEKQTDAPTRAIVETTTQETTKQKTYPIEIIDNYTLLQSLFLNIEPDMTLDKLESLGKQCGFFTSRDSSDYRTNLYIAIDNTPRPDGGYHLDFGVHYIWAFYERDSLDSEEKLETVYYYFSPSYYNVEYSIEGKTINKKHFFVNQGVGSVDPTVTYQTLQSALDAAIEMVENE